jgi:organic radical activating enzyme|tara:strand:- start:7740 stop:9098 length:1359 start_codon:yes stop_codon:yes gene_type:complete
MKKPNKLDETRDRNNAVSKSFCPAKWYNSTVWLGNGRTASCHHPEAHYIPTKEIFSSPSALHNTKFKKEQRKKMLDGERPSECGYCWRVEDADSVVHSDRTYKSTIYTDEEIAELQSLGWDADVDPKTLEISFDNLCNLSCSYCNAEFSSTWSNDIKKNGIYEGMETGGGQTYQNDGSHAYAFDPKKPEKNFFIQSFFKWFDASLKNNLKELRVTGGEPTRSPQFWELVDRCEDVDFKFAVNSNLIMGKPRLDRLVECSKKFKQFDLYTSCEASGKAAELIRSGLNYEDWLDNMRYFATHGKYTNINIMMTISSLCLFSITDFLSDIIDMKREFKRPGMFNLSLNILRFPSFQSVNLLPENIKITQAMKLEEWLSMHEGFLNDSEVNQIQRLVSYLRKVDIGYEDEDSLENKQNDFYKFFKSYTDRRNMNITEIITDNEFVDWWHTLREAHD